MEKVAAWTFVMIGLAWGISLIVKPKMWKEINAAMSPLQDTWLNTSDTLMRAVGVLMVLFVIVMAAAMVFWPGLIFLH